MGRVVVLFVLSIVGIFSFSTIVFGFSNVGGGHITLSQEAMAIEIDVHSGVADFERWAKEAMTGSLGNLLTGAYDEDCTHINPSAMRELPIDGKWPVGPNGWGNFFEHFFNPRTGVGLGSNRTAIARAEDYERKIKDIICKSRPRYDQLSEPSKKKVNDYFGRLMHLMQDMGISYHTKLEIHPFKADKPLEHYVETNWEVIKASDLFKEELLNTNFSAGRCIDPTVPMFRLAQWSNGLPANDEYWECISLPSQYCELKTQMVADYSTRMSARATKFTEGYIDQIWRAINSDCICQPPVDGLGRGQPDDTFSVNGSFLGTTQLDLSSDDRLNFFLRLALKKGDISPLYTKQMMNIYAEAKALPPTATQETKDEVQTRFPEVLATLNNLPVKDQDEWPDIALLENGYHDEALALINKAKEPVRFIAADFDPSLLQSNPILIIPSGGLIGVEKSAIFKATLDEYVKNNGTLIVFAQPYGYHFSVLPVPEEQDGTFRHVNGYGWEEDQNCFTNAVYLDGWHQIFAGQSRSTPTMNVDGYFTVYPSSSSVLLRRTVNGQPAMLVYPHGQGRVIVTSMYSDFAFGQSQASAEERALIRDMISWAKKPEQIPEVRRGEAISLSLNVANHTDTDAASAKVLIYSPDRSVLVSEETVSGPVPAHGSTQVAMQFSAAADAQRGIYHVDYMLLDSQGVMVQPQTETDSGRFVVSEPPSNPYKNPDFNFSATTNMELVPLGSDVEFTVHGWNNTQQSRTITVRYVFPHMYLIERNPSYGVFMGSIEPGKDSGWLTKTFTIGPSGKTSFNHIMRDAYHDDYIFANFYDEDNKLIGRAQRGFFLFYPSAQATVSPAKPAYLPGETMVVNAEFTNLSQNSFVATARIRLLNWDGSTLFEEERLVEIPAYGASRVDAAFVLPEWVSRGKYSVIATLSTGHFLMTTASTSVDVDSLFSRVYVVPDLPRPFMTGVNNVSFTLHNAWRFPINSGSLEINLQDPHGSSIFQNSYPFSLSPGETKVINTSVTLSELIFGNYTLYYTQSDETRTGGPARITIPNNTLLGLTLDKPFYKAGETIGVTATVLNSGKFELNDLEVAVTIPDLGLSETKFVTIPVGERATPLFSLPLPGNVSPGLYTVSGSVVLPSRARVTQDTTFDISPPSLVITFPGPRVVTSGSVMQLLVENDGGADTNYSGSISIRDKDEIAVYEGNVEGVIRVGERKVLADVVIPPQTAQGKHILAVLLQDHTSGSNRSLNIILDVTGITAGLQTRSSKDVYLGTEPITAISDILNGAYGIDSGNLKITVDTFSGQPGFTNFLPKNGWIEVSPRAVAVGSDGSVYISEACRILHFDTMWNLMDVWGSCGSDNGQFSGATHLAVGADGSVYVVDSGNHRIQRFTSYGAFLQTWGVRGFSDGQFLWPTALAVASDGTVYVADTNNNRIQRFTSDGAFMAKWGFFGTGNGMFSTPSDIATGPDGSVYVADSGNHRVQRFSPEGAYVNKWGSEGSGDGQFFYPQAIVVGLDGSVYVGNNDRIQKFTADGLFVFSGGSSGTGTGQFLEIASVALAPDGTIYAVDIENDDVQRFDSNLGFISHWGSHGNQDGWFHHPTYVASAPDGSVYVSDTNNHRIQKFDMNGGFIASWGSEGSGNGEFSSQAGIAVGPEGSIFVADYFNHRIQKFDSEGRFIRMWGGAGPGDGQFSYPDGIAVNSEGLVYVADRVNNRIQVFDSNGLFITKWSTGMPEGIAVGLEGSVYVLDYVYQSGWSKRIQKFNSNGTYLLEWEWWSMTDSGGIAVDKEGVVYLADGPFVHKFDSNGNYIEQLEAPGECTGLVVTTDGTVYCADSNLSRILKYTPQGATTAFERSIPLTLAPQAARQEVTSIGTLEEPGKYFLHATLTNSLGQKIAQSEYPFYVTKGSLVLMFSTDKAVYSPGEVVTIRGEVQNFTSVTAQGLAFAVNQQGLGESQSLYTATFDLGANSTYPFSVTTQAGSDGIYMLTGTLNHANTTVFEGNDRYEVATQNVSINLMSPDTVGANNFAISLEIKNEGKRDVTVTLTSPFGSQVLAITVGTSHALTYPNQQITEDTTYTFVLSGDVNQTIAKTVHYGLASTLAIQAPAMYPEGTIVVPISVGNEGSLDTAFSVNVTLEPSGLISQRTYFISQGQRISDNLLFDLAEGDYTLTLTSQSPPASTRASFSVRKELKVAMTPIVIGAPTGGLIPVSTEIVNTGAADIEGTVQTSFLNSQGALAWHANQAVSIPVSQTPNPVPISFSFSPAALPPGAYTVSVALLNNGGQELASQNMPLTITGGNVRISQMPSPQTVNAGADATFLFKVANTGGREAPAELTLKSHDFINLTRRELINPGEERDVQFAFPIPSDLEEKDYFAEYELRSAGTSIAKGQIKYHVAGINITVVAALDKEHYRDGETAHLFYGYKSAGREDLAIFLPGSIMQTSMTSNLLVSTAARISPSTFHFPQLPARSFFTVFMMKGEGPFTSIPSTFTRPGMLSPLPPTSRSTTPEKW